jgi:tetratricopeptide (TPR) repeat protein
MHLRIVIGLAVLLTLAGNLRAQEDIGAMLEKGHFLLEHKKYGEAVETFRYIIRTWPEDREHTPKAHLMLFKTLMDAGRFDHAHEQLRTIFEQYPESVEIRKHAYVLKRELQVRQNRHAEEEAARAYAEAKEQYERLRKHWEEQGLSPEQIRERQERIEQDRAHLAALEAELRELEAHLEDAGRNREAIERELDERRRAHAEKMRGPWKARRDEEMREMRREFLHLAERLGVPAEAAERLLMEHRERRRHLEGVAPAAPRPHREEDHHVLRRLEVMEKRFEELAMHMERFVHHLERREAETEKVIRMLHDRVEKLSHAVEKLMEQERREK